MSLALVVTAIVLAACSGAPGLVLPRPSRQPQRIAAAMMVAAALTGLAGAASVLREAAPVEALLPWPAAGDSLVGVDALSGFFLVPIFLMGALGSVYGLGYWPEARHPRNARKLQLFWGLLSAGMALLVISRHALGFLLGWEVMALSAFFLVATEDDRAETRAAGWLYLIAAHLGTLALFALFALWRSATGSYLLRPVEADVLGLGATNAMLAIALFAFGLKAGLMPLHFWLPGAHASAPSHVSAMLSGVVLKMGIYGLVRFFSLLPAPPAVWGGVVLVLGVTSGLLGVAFALGQHDLKRLLAYHSVENIGIILIGLGLALLGRSSGRIDWVVLGLGGCLLHVWNHAIFKSLLFLSAGAVVQAAGTREIDRLGGVARAMPWTAAMFLIGAVAICGLPPLNGFVSELLLYLGLLGALAASRGGGFAAVLAVPALAAIGALAVACFVKAYGTVFLGTPRSRAAVRVHESTPAMLAAMAVLAACCAAIGSIPELSAPPLDRAIAAWMADLRAHPVPLAGLAPLGAVGALSLALLALAALLGLALLPRRAAASAGTWDCGYAAPTSRMQYTSSSFAQTIVLLLRRVLAPEVHAPDVRGLNPGRSQMRSHVGDVVLDRLLAPASRNLARRLDWLHVFQRGVTQHYVLYILITVVLMLCTLLPVDHLAARLFSR